MKFLAFNNGYCVSDIKYVNKKLKSKKSANPITPGTSNKLATKIVITFIGINKFNDERKIL